MIGMESFRRSVDGVVCPVLYPGCLFWPFILAGIVPILHVSSNPADGYLLSVSLFRSVKKRAGLQCARLPFNEEFVVQMIQTHDREKDLHIFITNPADGTAHDFSRLGFRFVDGINN